MDEKRRGGTMRHGINAWLETPFIHSLLSCGDIAVPGVTRPRICKQYIPISRGRQSRAWKIHI